MKNHYSSRQRYLIATAMDKQYIDNFTWKQNACNLSAYLNQAYNKHKNPSIHKGLRVYFNVVDASDGIPAVSYLSSV